MRIAMIGLRGIPHTYGGGEEFVLHVAPLLAERGHEVIVYSRSGYYPDRASNCNRHRERLPGHAPVLPGALRAGVVFHRIWRGDQELHGSASSGALRSSAA